MTTRLARAMRCLPAALVVLAVVVLAACGSKSANPVPESGSVGSGAKCACKPDEQCVQRFDGTCGDRGVECVARPVSCPSDPSNACTPACGATYCPRPFQCEIRSPCGGEVTGAFTCYGP